MRKSRFSDSQIMGLLKKAESGVPIADICRDQGISTALFYRWRSRYGGMDVSMISRMTERETENARLQKMYAEERLKAEIVQARSEKKW